ncbi:MAG: helix-turn-helix transcriptional regulator [Magnetospiraceae bacterium]
MSKTLPCYLRTYRKRAGLTQWQLAHLLGLPQDTAISKLERRRRMPSLEVAFGCQAVFGVPADRIFPGVMEEARANVATRARQHRLSDSIPSYDSSE